MASGGRVRTWLTALVLLLGVYGTWASAQKEAERPPYPNGRFLATAEWLQQHLRDDGLVVVDVRNDKYFDGQLIPGAIRLPWGLFQENDVASGVAAVFVGAAEAQRILGDRGIARTDAVLLYDSVARDGGATSSYVFWVLDLLGHERKMILDGGIDAWKAAGGETVGEPRTAEPVLYQAPAEEVRLRHWAQGEFVRSRLGDPYYQILDVRSREEYLGEVLNQAVDGTPLKPGHIPTAVNVDYRFNRVDEKTKELKPYPALQDLYRGLDPSKAVITYCHSGRRASFGYFVLRLMGFDDVILYEPSWNEWGRPALFYPVETTENRLSGTELPGVVGGADGGTRRTPEESHASEPAKGGYVSCGG